MSAAPSSSSSSSSAHPPFNVDLFAIVKAVPTGDTLVLLKPGPAVAGPPPELRVHLSSVRAPALLSPTSVGANPSTTTTTTTPTDEPGAFAARERLRTVLVGQRVRFRLEYAVPALANRLMAAVLLPTTIPPANNTPIVVPSTHPAIAHEAHNNNNHIHQWQNVAVMLARDGLVRVRRPADPAEPRSIYYDDLCAAEDAAIHERVGLHASDTTTTLLPIRRLNPAINPVALAAECKGRTFNGIVEYVINGSTLKVLIRSIPPFQSPADPAAHLSSNTEALLPSDAILTVCLSGIQAPGFRRAEGEDVAKPMPFALNAKFLTETKLLHRDVLVLIEGADRNGVLFATVTDPSSNSYIGEELLRAGFAKTVGWSIELTSRAPALRAAERTARDARAGVWRGFVMPKAAAEQEFLGRCIEVVSGDTIVVLHEHTGEHRRVSLASVRAVRVEPIKDRHVLPTGPGADAKETLRKKLIGRTVRVHIEYTRPPPETSARKDPLVFVTVGREGDAKNPDVALPLISDGLLSVVRHRGEEDRSQNYELYLEREAVAKEAEKGVHKPSEKLGSGADFVRINNLTGADSKKRSRDVLAGLQRANPHQGVVDYVSSGSRMRIFLPKQAMLITVGLKAVRTPQPSRKSFLPDGTAQIESVGEAHGDEALAFAKENFMQRDVEVEISGVDRVGAFLGNVFLLSARGERVDVSKMLLSSGMGYLHESFDTRDVGGGGMVAAEKSARDGKIGLWLDYKEPEIDGAIKAMTLDSSLVTKKIVGVVSEVGFGGRIFVQSAERSKAILTAVETGLRSLNLDETSGVPISSLKHAELVAGKFSADGLWYRARILSKTADSVVVRFVDYGNEETLSADCIRRLNGAVGFMAQPPAALEVKLAHLVVPEANDNFGLEAGEFIRDLVYGRTVEVIVSSADSNDRVTGDVHILDERAVSGADLNGHAKSVSFMGSGGSMEVAKSTSLSEKLLESGIVRIVRKSDRASREAFSRLQEFERTGRATRDYLWTYGDPYESDCDDEDDVKEKNRVRRGGK